MANNLEVYKCELCGNIVEVFHAGGGELVCCGEPMKLQAENTVDAAKEKHVPVMEKGNGTLTVNVGSVPHPMEEKHYIEWIEVIADGNIHVYAPLRGRALAGASGDTLTCQGATRTKSAD